MFSARLIVVLLAAQWLAGQPNSWRDAYSYVNALQSGYAVYRDEKFYGLPPPHLAAVLFSLQLVVCLLT